MKRLIANIFLITTIFSTASFPIASLGAQSPTSTPPLESNPLQLSSDHVTLSVADIDKEEAWYVDTLGFQEIKRGATGTDYQFRQLSIPGYRIDLSCRKGSVRHARTGLGDMEQGWMHIVFKSPKIDAAYQRFTAKNADMNIYKGKDGAVNVIIIRDPEGNEIELQR